MKKKLNCKEVPKTLYAIINSELVQYIYKGAEKMRPNFWYLKYESSHDYDIYYLVWLEEDDIYVKDKMFFDNKKECIEDYLDTLKDVRILLDNEKEEIKIKDNNLKRLESMFKKLLNSLSNEK
jgi:hypothetical protein